MSEPIDSLPYLISQGFSPTIIIRFWRRVVKSDGCWLFWGAQLPKGYGRIGIGGGAYILAHRLSWIIHVGPIPHNFDVLHSCDFPGCIHPNHLFLGTNADNIRDMISKGRDVGNRRITNAIAIEVHRLSKEMTQADVARKLNMRPGDVSRIVHGVRWSRVIPMIPH